MRFLLVGTGFHPGAQALLLHGLGANAPVALVPEPANPYDALAVRVEVAQAAVQDSHALRVALLAQGLDAPAFPFTLGHLAAKLDTKAAQRAIAEGLDFVVVDEWHRGGKPLEGTLVFASGGSVLVETKGTKE